MSASVTPTGLGEPEGLEPRSRLHPSDAIPSAFTPGPWGLNETRYQVAYTVLRNITDSQGNFVVAAPAGDTFTSDRANANLIAAAPDMFEALEGAMREMPVTCSAYQDAKAALAKARGEA